MKKLICVILTAAMLLSLSACFTFEKDITKLSPEEAYEKALEYLESGDTARAAMHFGRASGYLDARERSFALWNEIVRRDTISAATYHSVAVANDGTVDAVGYDAFGRCGVSYFEDIVDISAGTDHTIGLRADGLVTATQYEFEYAEKYETDFYNGQCEVYGWTDIVDISAGRYHTVGLRADGTVVATRYIDIEK